MCKEFILYQEALDLKELGFDELCFGSYGDGKLIQSIMVSQWKNNEFNIILAPLYQQAFHFFRETFSIFGKIGRDEDNWEFSVYDFKSGNKHIPTGFKSYGTYEEAQLECLKKLIEIVKNKL